ncbi:MAG: SDR family oxidoreductase [Candidatus Binatus sp.]|jgi:NAD(P)-dependent dehydrogenase (short-subunit alcohol dehydrogenase family)|uniref:SDR family oxidoreductase n=1 Tax=Candidatus Binatus sp. TaxID=2811406 RepID=UPI003D0B6E6F
MRPNVVITGVSTGIGLDAARLLIERGYRVFGSVRSQVDADRVGAALGPHFTPLLFDVTDEAAIATAAEKVRDAIGDEGLCALVNNSGISGAGPLMHFPLDEMRKMFEVNVFGLLAVTQAFLPLLGARRDCPHPPGRIINISSISGGLVFPFVGAYGASKHAVEALTDGLRRELGLYNIHVIAIEPGNIRTPIWEKSAGTDARYARTDYAPILEKLPPIMAEMVRRADPVERVSVAIHKAITAPRPKTRYPLTWLWPFSRVLGDRVLDRMMRRAMGLS